MKMKASDYVMKSMNMMKMILVLAALAVTSGTALAGQAKADVKVIPVTADNYVVRNYGVSQTVLDGKFKPVDLQPVK